MATTAFWYGKAFVHSFTGDFDLTSDTIKMAFCTSAYTPNQDTHEFFSDITNEVSGGGYTAGGVTLTTVTVTYDATSNTTTITADPVEIASSTITARTAVLYKSTGTAATSPLIGWQHSDVDIVSSGGPFTFTPDADGILDVTPEAAA